MRIKNMTIKSTIDAMLKTGELKKLSKMAASNYVLRIKMFSCLERCTQHLFVLNILAIKSIEIQIN